MSNSTAHTGNVLKEAELYGSSRRTSVVLKPSACEINLHVAVRNMQIATQIDSMSPCESFFNLSHAPNKQTNMHHMSQCVEVPFAKIIHRVNYYSAQYSLKVNSDFCLIRYFSFCCSHYWKTTFKQPNSNTFLSSIQIGLNTLHNTFSSFHQDFSLIL